MDTKMNTEQVLIVCATLVIITLIVTVGSGIYQNNKIAMQNGYEQATLQGYSTPQWVKVK